MGRKRTGTTKNEKGEQGTPIRNNSAYQNVAVVVVWPVRPDIFILPFCAISYKVYLYLLTVVLHVILSVDATSKNISCGDWRYSLESIKRTGTC